MAKGKQRSNSRNDPTSSPTTTASKGKQLTPQQRRSPSASETSVHFQSSSSMPPPPPSLLPDLSLNHWIRWFRLEGQGLSWVLACTLIGVVLGFGIGSGLLSSGLGGHHRSKHWRVTLGNKIRSSMAYQILTMKKKPWEPVLHALSFLSLNSISQFEGDGYGDVKENPSHPFVFLVLREAIVREAGGFVHYGTWYFLLSSCLPVRNQLIFLFV